MLENALQNAITRENQLLTTILEKNQVIQALANKITELSKDAAMLQEQLEATHELCCQEGESCEETQKSTESTLPA